MEPIEGVVSDDEDRWRAVAERVFLNDFPLHAESLPSILNAGIESRKLERACIAFFGATHAPWPRYDAHLAHWNKQDPRIPQYEDGEIIEDPDFREAGELLAHRITFIYNAEKKRERLMKSVDLSPYWILGVIDDGRTPSDCVTESQVAHRYNHPYWQEKQVPCERLFCRCRIDAARDDEIPPADPINLCL